jgi:hypothetical protein
MMYKKIPPLELLTHIHEEAPSVMMIAISLEMKVVKNIYNPCTKKIRHLSFFPQLPTCISCEASPLAPRPTHPATTPTNSWA